MNNSLFKRRAPSQTLIDALHAASGFQRYNVLRTVVRHAHISSTPVAAVPRVEDSFAAHEAPQPQRSPDARFEVYGSSCSLLSASLSALQNLYTRRGTLVAVEGQMDNLISRLSILEPFRRLIFGIPFLYQRINSTTPFTALISTRDANSSFSAIRLDGTVDWMVMQRRGLLAWSGQSLVLQPKSNPKLGLSHWGDTQISGRGLVALVGKGQIYQVDLKEGEEYLMHPSNVLAYSLSSESPRSYRIKSSSITLSVPGILSENYITSLYFIRYARQSNTWKMIKRMAFNLRTWSRRTIWGDRLFLQFKGPMTILMQSRGSKIGDVLSDREINEIADTPSKLNPSDLKTQSSAGQVQEKARSVEVNEDTKREEKTMLFAEVGPSGKVTFMK